MRGLGLGWGRALEWLVSGGFGHEQQSKAANLDRVSFFGRVGAAASPGPKRHTRCWRMGWCVPVCGMEGGMRDGGVVLGVRASCSQNENRRDTRDMKQRGPNAHANAMPTPCRRHACCAQLTQWEQCNARRIDLDEEAAGVASFCLVETNKRHSSRTLCALCALCCRTLGAVVSETQQGPTGPKRAQQGLPRPFRALFLLGPWDTV